eukprot:g19449.t1
MSTRKYFMRITITTFQIAGRTSCVLPSRHFRLQDDSLPSGRQLHRSRCRVSSSRSRSPASHVSPSRPLSPASHAPVSSFIKTQDQQVAVSLAVLTPSLQLVLLIFYLWFISRQDMNKLIHMFIGNTAVLAPVKIDWVDTVAGDKACGLFATTDLPAGFKLGLLEPGSVNLSDIGDSPRERAASVHFCMITKDGLVVGLQPIFAINPNCLNAMHILNSALRFSKTTPNAKIEKGTNCVALSSPVFEGEEILLHQYLTKSGLSALDRNELPTAAEAHFLFMRTACRHQKAIPVFQIQWRNELKLFFIVPPTLESLHPASIELLDSCDIPASTELLDSWDSAASINLLDSWDSSASIELLAPHQGFESGGDASDDTSVNEESFDSEEMSSQVQVDLEKGEMFSWSCGYLGGATAGALQHTSGADDLEEHCSFDTRVKSSLFLAMSLNIPTTARSRRTTRPYKMVKRNPRPPKLQREGSFERWLGMRYAELDEDVKSICCNKWRCNVRISTSDVITERISSCSLLFRN